MNLFVLVLCTTILCRSGIPRDSEYHVVESTQPRDRNPQSEPKRDPQTQEKKKAAASGGCVSKGLNYSSRSI
jgi:hypothetical protein